MVELGSGLGISGILLANFGAHVTLTDVSEQIPFLSQNINLNMSILGRCDCRVLNWGGDLSSLGDCLGTTSPDIIIASDVVYQQSSFSLLCETIACLSLGESPLIFIAYKARSKLESQFFVEIQKKFVVREVSQGLERYVILEFLKK